MHLKSSNIQHLYDKTVLFGLFLPPKHSLHNTVPKSNMLSEALKHFSTVKEHISTVEVLETFTRNTRMVKVT